MSIPPGQPPNPYQQNSPHGQPQPQGPAPQNPYAQPTMPAGVPVTGPPPPAGPPPFGAVPPVPPEQAKKPAPGWLWGIGGVVLASAVWAGTVFATGALADDADGPSPVLGHRYEKDLCDTVDLDAFSDHYTIPDDSDGRTGWGSRRRGLDQSYCSWSLQADDASSSDYSSSYISANGVWHKVTDPQGEFASSYRGYEDRSTEDYEYEAEALEGLGDEAFLITETADASTSRQMTMAVRAGWFTYQMDWSWYGGGTDSAEPPSYTEVEEMLRDETETVLDELKK